MSKNSSKQLVDQLKGWVTWLKFSSNKQQNNKPAKRK